LQKTKSDLPIEFSIKESIALVFNMGKYNFTNDGVRKLADLLRSQMEDDFPKVTIKELTNRLAAIGYDVDVSKLARLRNGVRSEPSAALIWAIAKLEFLKDPTGKPYSHEELLEMMAGRLESEKIFSVMTEKSLNAAPVNLIRGKMREMKKNAEAFARFCDIPVDRMSAILQGEIPTWTEFINLGRVLFNDKNPAPLISLYPLPGDTVSTSATAARKSHRGEKTD
jgi:hypothetical protein